MKDVCWENTYMQSSFDLILESSVKQKPVVF